MARIFINGLRPSKTKEGTRVAVFNLSEPRDSSLREIVNTVADPNGKVDYDVTIKPGCTVKFVIRDFGFVPISFEMNFPEDDFYYTVQFQKDTFISRSVIEKRWENLRDWDNWNTIEQYNKALAESQIEQRRQKEFSKDFKLIKFLGEEWSAKVYSCKIKNDG